MPSVNQSAPVPSMEGAWKTLGHVVALADVSLDAFSGQTFAVVGDNGAGKSTLVNCISGFYRLDAGLLIILGRTAKSSRDVKDQVGVVYQDLAVVSTLDVVTSLFLERPFTRGGVFVKRRAVYAAAAARAFEEARVGTPSVRIPSGELSGGTAQFSARRRVAVRL